MFYGRSLGYPYIISVIVSLVLTFLLGLDEMVVKFLLYSTIAFMFIEIVYFIIVNPNIFRFDYTERHIKRAIENIRNLIRNSLFYTVLSLILYLLLFYTHYYFFSLSLLAFYFYSMYIIYFILFYLNFRELDARYYVYGS
ncbi:MAG: hypothetical protein ACP5T9_05305 [Thermoplasmata archaeon]